MEVKKELLLLMLPEEIVEYFECVGIEKSLESVKIVLEEKNKLYN